MKERSYDPEDSVTRPLYNPAPLPMRQKLSASYGADGRAAGVNRGVSGANAIPQKLERGVQSASKPKTRPGRW
jgi:hypothetical protein